MGPHALVQYLENTSLSALLPGPTPSSRHQHVITLEHNQTIAEALKALAKKKVLSAPLVVTPDLEDLSTTEPSSLTPCLLVKHCFRDAAQEGRSCIIGCRAKLLQGWIDVSDVLRGLIAYLKEKHAVLPVSMLLLMSELEHEGKQFSRKPLITLTGGSDRRLIYTGEVGATLMQTIREQFLGLGGISDKVVHRIAVFDDDGTITNIISQLDVVRHLCSHSEQLLGPLALTSIHSLGLPYSHTPLISVDPSVPTLIAFDHMLRAGVSGAPVVTSQGEMVANLSVSDLKCIQPEHLGVLALPVAEFMALLHRTTYLGYSQTSSTSKDHAFFAGTPRPRTHIETSLQASRLGGPGEDDDVRLISVRPTSTLKEVLHMLGDNHIHRVYVLDPEAAPGERLKGVITPTDILCWAAGIPAPKKEATHRTCSGPAPAFVAPPAQPLVS